MSGAAERFLRSAKQSLPFRSLEEMFTSYDGFGLITATPLQRTLCRVWEGKPIGELWNAWEVQAAFAGVKPPMVKPDEMCILSGIRTGKSLFCATTGAYASQTCDCDSAMLKPGDIPRFSIVSTGTDTAKPVFDHLVGSFRASPRLRRLLIGEPTADSVLLRHPSGRPIEIKVVAGSRAGSTLVGRWSIGVIFDEAPRMVGEAEAKINLDHLRDAVRAGRVLEGCTIMYIGSPWAPTGPIYDIFSRYWGKPEKAMVVVKTPAPAMNPHWWTPERIAEKRKNAPDAAQTDIDAEFRDAETSLFSNVSLVNATREKPTILPPEDGYDYSCAIDPATRGNAWTLVICTKGADGRIRVVLGYQWLGTRQTPLQPRDVMGEIANLLRPYGWPPIITDQWCSDAIRDFAQEEGMCCYDESMSRTEKVRKYTALAQRIDAGLVELAPNEEMLRDLRAVKRRATADGAMIVLPKTGDGRHADFAPALVLAASRWLDEPVAVEDEGGKKYDEDEELEMVEIETQLGMMYGEDEPSEQGEQW
jgi:hypothetical protein